MIDSEFAYDLLEPIFKLKGIAELFQSEAPDDELRTFSKEALNGIYFTLSGISDELQSLKNRIEVSGTNEG